MKVAIIHDWLVGMGGGERVVIELKKIFPDAPIYTTVYNPLKLVDELKNADVRTSFMQKKKKMIKHHQKYLHYMPMAFESFDLSEYELVISSSSSCSHGVITRPDTIHISYCHTPMRYGWDFYHEYTDKMKFPKKNIIKYMMNYIRIWDKVSADRVDYFVANSNYVAKRINKHYRREAKVIYPPVRTDIFNIKPKKDFYLILSRLVEYKKIHLAVEAFNELGLPLYIIGTGPEEKKLKKLAASNIRFLGSLSDEEVINYYAEAKGFIFPGEEDFGITPVEAQASGTPVIAYGKGGSLETVIEGKTGVFFNEQTSKALEEAVRRFEMIQFDASDIKEHANQFSNEMFKKNMEDFIAEKLKK